MIKYFWLVLFISFSANNLSALTLTLKSNATVSKKNILLKDIAKNIIFTDTKYNNLSNLVVGIAPPPLRYRYVSSDYLKSVLYSIVSPQEKIIISPHKIKVTRTGFILTKAYLEKQIIAFIQKMYLPDTFSIDHLGGISNYVLPDTNFYIRIKRVNPRTPGIGLNLFIIKVFADNKPYTEFSFSSRISKRQTVFILTKLMRKGESFNPANLKKQVIKTFKNNITYIGDTGSLLNSVASRYIPNGARITKEMVAEKPMIRKNDIVKLFIKGSNFSVWTRVIALQSGIKGDKIWVENQKSRKRFRVTIVSNYSVVIESYK